MKPWWFAVAAVFLAMGFSTPTAAGQQVGSVVPVRDLGDLTRSAAALSPEHSFSSPTYLHGFSFVRPVELPTLLSKPVQINAPGTIAKMEAAFYCNDTPFIDQVRLPVASLWRGRLKLVGMESDVTTANFVLGLPGAGTLQSLSLTGSGHLAMHAPPSDQLVAMHMLFYLRGSAAGAQDNSGLRGVQYLVRASRDFFQNFGAR